MIYNLYLVISEALSGLGLDPPESYRIAEIVNARNRSQAKWLAWKTDKDFDGDVKEMPHFSVNLKIKNTELQKPMVVTNQIDRICESQSSGLIDDEGLCGYLWCENQYLTSNKMLKDQYGINLLVKEVCKK